MQYPWTSESNAESVENTNVTSTDTTKEPEEKTPADLELEQLENPEIPTISIIKTEDNVSDDVIPYEIPQINKQWHFEKKVSFINKFPLFREALLCAIATHEFGNNKYEKYSWQNNPEESYATTSVNFDALCRHLYLFMTKSENTDTDESGMNHMVHVAGRCHMLITNFYREYLFENNDYPKQIDVRPVVDQIRKSIGYEKSNTIFDGKIDQLSAEIKLSIFKCPDEFIDFIENDVNVNVKMKKEALLKLADEVCCQIALTFDSIDLMPGLSMGRLDKLTLDIDYLFYYIAAYIHLSPEIVESAKKWCTDEIIKL